MEDFYPIYIINLETHEYDMCLCNTPAEREQVQDAVFSIMSMFNLYDTLMIKYVEPEFEE